MSSDDSPTAAEFRALCKRYLSAVKGRRKMKRKGKKGGKRGC